MLVDGEEAKRMEDSAEEVYGRVRDHWKLLVPWVVAQWPC